MFDVLSGLNDRQRDAVCRTEGYVRVIAGAGSGKTKALTHRYAYLVRAGGIHPGNILCVTFTSKAAGEMRSRVRALLAETGAGADTSLITTYHGFCVRVLREDIGRLFYPDSFGILDVAGQKRILEEIYAELDIKLDHASFEKIIGRIDKMKDDTAYVDVLVDRNPPAEIPPAEQGSQLSAASLDELVIRRYLARQKKVFALDFNDLVNFVFVLFERFPDTLEKWRDRLHYIQVDEFQDSSKRELKLIDMLSAGHKNLFVVGDPDQNIYEWRGADVRILVDFDKTHAGAETVVMDRNYRSTRHILACANTLIDYNADRVKKSLYTEGGDGADVIHLHAKSEEEEAAAIIANLRSLTGEGYSFSDVAVLYRSGFLSQFVEAAFMNAGIPYEIVGSMRFFDRMEIRDAVAYMKLIASDDDEALLRVLNKPRRGMGRSVADRLKIYARSAGLSLYEALRECARSREYSRTGAAALVAVIEKLRRSAEKTSVSELLDRALTESGYERYIRESGNMERFENLAELKRLTLETERSYGKITVGDSLPPEFMPVAAYLQHIALLRADETEGGSARDCVKLMTVHAAKGLEFPVVFLVGMTDGVTPSSRTLEERRQAGLEEERRLCFVAITRAKERLFFTDSEGAGQSGVRKQPSRFLKEIGEENYVRIGEISKDLQNKAYRAVAAPPQTGLHVGSEVDHVMFGHGVIESADVERHVYNVRFERTGELKPISDDYDFGLWQRLKSEADAAALIKSTEERLASNAAEGGGIEIELADNDADGDVTVKQDNPPVTVTETLPTVPETVPAVSPEPRQLQMNVPDDAPIHDDAPAPFTIPTPSIFTSKVKNLDYIMGKTGAPEDENDENGIDGVDAAEDEVTDADFEPEEGETVAEITLPAYTPRDKPEPENTVSRKRPEPEPENTAPRKRPEPEPENTAPRKRTEPDGVNLWNDPSVPKSGWTCEGITDLGEPAGVCEMCGRQIIRYVHHMSHPDYRSLGVGCVCAGRMEGDPEGAKTRENRFKSSARRRETFVTHEMKRSKNGNEYFKHEGEIVTVLADKYRKGCFKAVVRGQFTKSCPSVREALSAAFDILEAAK